MIINVPEKTSRTVAAQTNTLFFNSANLHTYLFIRRLKNFSNFCSMPILAAVCMYASNSNYHYHYHYSFYCTLQFIFCRQVVVFSAPKEKVHVETFLTPAPTPKKQSKTNHSFLHKCLFWIILFFSIHGWQDVDDAQFYWILLCLGVRQGNCLLCLHIQKKCTFHSF